MKRSLLLFTCLILCCSLIVIGADKSKKINNLEKKTAPLDVRTTHQQPTQAPVLAPVVTPEVLPEGDDVPSPTAEAGSAAFQLNWYSINSGGAINATSTNFKMGLSVGQSVAGEGSSTNYNMGIGFWYGAGGGGGYVCPIEITGDVNTNGSITSADIIYMVVFVFKGGPAPQPCPAAGDVNCSGSDTSADIIFLVNHVFKGGPLPCDACTLDDIQVICLF